MIMSQINKTQHYQPQRRASATSSAQPDIREKVCFEDVRNGELFLRDAARAFRHIDNRQV